jgi:formylglycine-generating enzyme required for sulfatase activity
MDRGLLYDSNSGNPGDGRVRPTGNCNHRVIRGGSGVSYPLILRSANRYQRYAGDRYNAQGFRVARNP